VAGVVMAIGGDTQDELLKEKLEKIKKDDALKNRFDNSVKVIADTLISSAF
jgi:hypothetical protein